MQKPDGSLNPIYDTKNGEVVNTEQKWSTQSGSYHTKVAMGLVDLYGLTSDQTYANSAIGICDFALQQQTSSGRFISFRDTGKTNVHPHCYSAEGLYYVGKKIGNDEYVESAKRATAWTLNNADRLWQIYEPDVDVFSGDERSDIFAQTLRLGVLFAQDDSDFMEEYRPALNHLARTVQSYQDQAADVRQHGGINYGNHVIDKNVNSWCSMFAVQAMEYYKQVVADGGHVDGNLLI